LTVKSDKSYFGYLIRKFEELVEIKEFPDLIERKNKIIIRILEFKDGNPDIDDQNEIEGMINEYFKALIAWKIPEMYIEINRRNKRVFHFVDNFSTIKNKLDHIEIKISQNKEYEEIWRKVDNYDKELEEKISLENFLTKVQIYYPILVMLLSLLFGYLIGSYFG